MPWLLPATWGDDAELRELRKFYKTVSKEMSKLRELQPLLDEAQDAIRDERRRNGDGWSAVSADDRLTATRLEALANRLRGVRGESGAADELRAEAKRLKTRIRVTRKRNGDYRLDVKGLDKSTAKELRYTDFNK